MRAFVRCLVTLALVAGLAVPMRSAAAVYSCAPPGCVDITVPYPAGLVVPNATVRVVLPSSYSASGTARYPVLYLLHGVGDTYTTWSDRLKDLGTDPGALADTYNLIIVMPDGGRGSEAGWYSDWVGHEVPSPSGSGVLPDWETFHTEVLVLHIDKTFRTRGAQQRMIAGASMGGFGALSYAARHPGMFRAAASFSGFLDTMHEAPVSWAAYDLLGQHCCRQFHPSSPDFSLGSPRKEVWGDQIRNAAVWRAHNPRDLALSRDASGDSPFAGTWVYAAWGSGQPSPPSSDGATSPHLYVQERYLREQGAAFAQALAPEVNHGPGQFPGHLYHDWKFWVPELRDTLQKLAADMPGFFGGITGSVSGKKTKPKEIEGATVDCGTAGSATTDADGGFSIGGVPAGKYRCTASAAGYTSATRNVEVAPGRTAKAKFSLRKA